MHLIQNRRNYAPVSILHTSDIHLPGSAEAPINKSMWQSVNPFHALEAIVNKANSFRVDLVLISGDLFDDYHPSQEAVSRAIEIMTELVAPAVIIPGNHDALGDAETYHMPHWDDTGLYPHIIKQPAGEILEIPNIPILVWGRAMMEHTSDFQPLKGIPGRNGSAWHVAMGHGFFYTQNESVDRSSPIFDKEIRDSGWDYVALGHKHIFVDVSQNNVKAAYSGSPVDLLGRAAKAVIASFDGRRSDQILLKRVDIL